MPFSNLGLRAELLRALESRGYTCPTPVQEQAIPLVMSGRDVLAGAQTGTGKTAAFTLPMLQLLSEGQTAKRNKFKVPRALVLTPTRELAAQVQQSVVDYGENLRLHSTVIFGGVNINPQKAIIRRGVDVVVATPGRLLDHVGQGTIDLSAIEILVLDEADRMLDMGFIHDIKKILARLPKQRQNLMFSATYSKEIKQLADRLLNNPASVEVARRNTAAETVTQSAYRVDSGKKIDLLVHLIEEQNLSQVLVFTRTKHRANRLADQLKRAGIRADAIHGNKSQNARTRALDGFKKGKVRVLVATEVAARGLDIDRLPHVINFELPNVPEDYVHRIGRTGRAGEQGDAISLVAGDEMKLLKGIQRLLNKEIPILDTPQFSARPNRPVLEKRDANPSTPSRRKRPRRKNQRAPARQHEGSPREAHKQEGQSDETTRPRKRRPQKNRRPNSGNAARR